MVDLLGRAGRLEEAVRFIEDMHLEPNAVIWETLLGSCKIHGEGDILEFVTRKIMELEPSNPSYLTLISNVSASMGQWKDALISRVAMRQQDDLNWPQRINVILELARLLKFLHGQDKPHLVFNINASHIMLDWVGLDSFSFFRTIVVFLSTSDFVSKPLGFAFMLEVSYVNLQDFKPKLIDFGLMSKRIIGEFWIHEKLMKQGTQFSSTKICECPVLFALLEVINVSGNRLTDACGSYLSTILEKCKGIQDRGC